MKLEECETLTDEGLLPFLSGQKELETVDFYSLKKITGKALEPLKNCKSLKSLVLVYCDSMTDEVFASISEQKEMIELDLFGCPLISDVGLTSLSRLTHLETLRIGGSSVINSTGNPNDSSRITDAGLKNLPVRIICDIFEYVSRP